MMRRAVRWVVDVALITGAWVLAFGVRFEFALNPARQEQLADTLPYVILLKVACLSILWVHKSSWRYVGMTDMFALVRAALASTSVLLAVRLLAERFTTPGGPWADAVIPWSVIAADFAFTLIALAGIRVLRRSLSERSEIAGREAPEKTRRTLIIGAGRAGAMMAKEILARPDIGRTLVGFIDDNAAKRGQRIANTIILGSTADLPRLVEQHRIDEVVIAIAGATGPDIRRINLAVKDAGLVAQIIPGLYELVDGSVNLSRLRPVAIDDLLRRDAVELDISGIRDIIGHDVVMVTGAGGSIGSELCRQLAPFGPRAIVLVERAETPLWAIERELRGRFPDVTFIQELLDVQQAEQVAQVMLRHRPSTVFHAAAHKHVPMCEQNPDEAVRNNVFGTKSVVDAAVAAGVARFVLISTDKAVDPSSVMGATKRLAEQYVGVVAARTGLPYVSVRFGNVLGSNGSVVPIFKEQIAAGGPVTVTDPEMTRYFMTIPEASQLVVQAATLGASGDLFVLEMGRPVKIVDLARDLIRLSGLEPDVDVMIEFTGIRDGEKLHEVLSYDHEGLEPTSNPLIHRRGEVPVMGLQLNGPLGRMRNPQLRSDLVRAFDDSSHQPVR